MRYRSAFLNSSVVSLCEDLVLKRFEQLTWTEKVVKLTGGRRRGAPWGSSNGFHLLDPETNLNRLLAPAHPGEAEKILETWEMLFCKGPGSVRLPGPLVAEKLSDESLDLRTQLDTNYRMKHLWWFPAETLLLMAKGAGGKVVSATPDLACVELVGYKLSLDSVEGVWSNTAGRYFPDRSGETKQSNLNLPSVRWSLPVVRAAWYLTNCHPAISNKETRRLMHMIQCDCEVAQGALQGRSENLLLLFQGVSGKAKGLEGAREVLSDGRPFVVSRLQDALVPCAFGKKDFIKRYGAASQIGTEPSEQTKRQWLREIEEHIHETEIV